MRFAQVQDIVARHCLACHAAKPTFQGINEAPKGFLLDTPERIRKQAGPIHAQTVIAKAMPPGNLTRMTDEERSLLDRWVRGGAKLD